MTRAIVERDGKRYFNPECVEQHGASVAVAAPDGGKWSLCDCAEKNSDMIRSWLREHLEAELQTSLPDLPPPVKPWECVVAGPLATGTLYRARGKVVQWFCIIDGMRQEWRDCDNGVTLEIVREVNDQWHNVTESEAEMWLGKKLFGREIIAKYGRDR